MSVRPVASDFEAKLLLLRDQLVAAQVCLEVWEHLSNRSAELASALDRYRGFFVPTILPHQTLFFIKMAIATDHKDRRQPSLYEVLRLIEGEPSLAPGLDVGSLRTRVDRFADVIRRVRRARDRRFAHVDTRKNPPRVKLGEYRRLLEELSNHDAMTYPCARSRILWPKPRPEGAARVSLPYRGNLGETMRRHRKTAATFCFLTLHL